MAKTLDRAKEIAHDTVHPVETGKDLAAEAGRGRSARTPAIAIGGVTLAVGVVVAVVVAVALLVYYLV